MELSNLLAELDAQVADEFKEMPDVTESWDGKIERLPIQARRWIQIPDLVAVVADLKNSTKLGTGRNAASTASIYQAATGGVVKVFNNFSADFIQIQGDGAFALFWGERRYERAMCSAITVQSHGEILTRRLEAKWPDAPTTGIKVGVAAGRTLVKRVGTPRNPAEQEPIWAGKPVNFASKAAQGADRHQIVITGSVWDAIENNAYLTASCDCGAPAELWRDVTIEKLPDGDVESMGRLLEASWCQACGPRFCQAILDGKTVRSNATAAAARAASSQRDHSLRAVKQQQRRAAHARGRGLRR